MTDQVKAVPITADAPLLEALKGCGKAAEQLWAVIFSMLDPTVRDQLHADIGAMRARPRFEIELAKGEGGRPLLAVGCDAVYEDGERVALGTYYVGAAALRDGDAGCVSARH